jgi:hypothetical protein
MVHGFEQASFGGHLLCRPAFLVPSSCLAIQHCALAVLSSLLCSGNMQWIGGASHRSTLFVSIIVLAIAVIAH